MTTPQAIDDLKVKIASATQLLRGEAESLARDMRRLAERLEATDATLRLNDSGEIQGRGARIDTLCARIEALKQALALLLRVEEAA